MRVIQGSGFLIHKLFNYSVSMTLVLCGCEMFSLTLRNKHRLVVFEDKVLRRTFGPKMDEVRGGWRKNSQRGAL
jgi:hypothetical protein